MSAGSFTDGPVSQKGDKMKRQSALLLVLLLTACAPQPSPSLATAAPTRASALPTATIATQLTATRTPAAIPTLTLPQMRDRIFGFLISNRDCAVPCIWGFVPGSEFRTRVEELETGFLYENTIDSYSDLVMTDSGAAFYFHFVDDDSSQESNVGFTIDLVVGFDNDLDNVLSTQIYIEAFRESGAPPNLKSLIAFESGLVKEFLSKYSIEEVVAIMGEPQSTFAYMVTESPGDNDISFLVSVVLFYPEGLFVEYIVPLRTSGGNQVVCLGEPGILWLESWSSNKSVSLESIAVGKPSLGLNTNNIDKFVDFKEVTGVSISEILTQYSELGPSYCVPYSGN